MQSTSRKLAARRYGRGGSYRVLVLVLVVVVGCVLASTAAAHLGGVDGPVRALAVYGGDLVAAGDFEQAGGVAAAHIARWDGSAWQPLGSGTDAPVHALVVLGSELVAGGEFTQAGGVAAAHVARWDGSAWHDLGAGTDGAVYALAQQHGVYLYVGGEFTTAGPVSAHGVAQWLFGNWSALGSGLEGRVRSLALSQNRLSACGSLVLPSNNLSARVAGFDAGTWNDGNGALQNASAYVLYEHAGELHLGGRFAQVDWQTTGYSVGRQVGSRWLPLGYGFTLGTNSQPGYVFALRTFNTELIAAGRFDAADIGPASNIAHWNGSVWSPLGDGIDGDVLALAVYDGNLVAGGAFSHAGGVPASNLALYDGSAWSSPLTGIEIQAFRANTDAVGVHLSWSLSPEAVQHLAFVVVERGTNAGDVLIEASPPLPVQRDMAYTDADASDAAVIRYRLQLRGRDGTRRVGPELQVQAGASSEAARIVAAFDPGGTEPIRIRFRTGPQRVPLRLSLHDVRGRQVRGLDAGWCDPGEHLVLWDRQVDGAPAARGLYLVHLQAGGRSDARKLVVR